MQTKPFDGFLSKPQAAEALGVSDRQIERLVAKGDLHQAMMDVPGRRPMPMFEPREIRELKAKLNPPMAMANGNGESAALVRASRGGGPVVLVQQQAPQEKRIVVPVWEKRYLTLREAAAYTGWRQVDLETLISEGSLRVREFVISAKGKRRLISREELNRL